MDATTTTQRAAQKGKDTMKGTEMRRFGTRVATLVALSVMARCRSFRRSRWLR